MSLIMGSHVSFTQKKQLLGCVEQTLAYGGNTFMFYTGSPQSVKRFPVVSDLTKAAFALMQEHKIKFDCVFVHAPYIINLANPKTKAFSISFLKQEIKRCLELGITKMVLHPGNHVGLGREVGINNIINALNEIINPKQRVIIYLETMAGKGTEIGSTFQELSQIIAGIKYQDQIMVCFDTCHVHDAGYDLTDFALVLKEFDQTIGLSKLGCIHLNDSKNKRGLRKDRHANIGLGEIGFNSLLAVVNYSRLKGIPLILETPYINDGSKTYPPYKFEIEMLKQGKMNPKLETVIKEYYQNN